MKDIRDRIMTLGGSSLGRESLQSDPAISTTLRIITYNNYGESIVVRYGVLYPTMNSVNGVARAIRRGVKEIAKSGANQEGR